MTTASLPAPSVKTCLGRIDADQPPLFTVGSKRTFKIGPGGPLVPAEEQEPIIEEAAYAPTETKGFAVPLRLPELCPTRVACSLIIHATSRPPAPTSHHEVVLQGPGGFERRLQLIGDRRLVRLGGGWAFSDPEPFQEMPLSWDRAYGGIDKGIYMHQAKDMDEKLRAMMAPLGCYPRNDLGRGYAVHGSEAPLQDLALPNVELLEDRLTVDRLVCPSLDMWHAQPRPAGFGFWEPHWPDLSRAPLSEEQVGLLPPGLTEQQRTCEPDDVAILPAFFHTCAPGMELPGLKGNERFILHGVDGDQPRQIDLPGAPPRTAVLIGQRSMELTPQLHQVVVDLDAGLLTMLWGGTVSMEHPVFAGMTVEQIAELPGQAE